MAKRILMAFMLAWCAACGEAPASPSGQAAAPSVTPRPTATAKPTATPRATEEPQPPGRSGAMMGLNPGDGEQVMTGEDIEMIFPASGQAPKVRYVNDIMPPGELRERRDSIVFRAFSLRAKDQTGAAVKRYGKSFTVTVFLDPGWIDSIGVSDRGIQDPGPPPENVTILPEPPTIGPANNALLSLLRWDPEAREWRDVEGARPDVNAYRISAAVDQFGEYAVIYRWSGTP